MSAEATLSDQLLCKAEVARRLGCKLSTVDTLLKQGYIKAAALPAEVRFRFFSSSVEECLRRMRGEQSLAS
jgi:predicted site-specific integrase-resolvase